MVICFECYRLCPSRRFGCCLLCEYIVFLCLFVRDADETIAWIQEKDAVLSLDDYGRDLASVQALQRKHEGVERDLAALEEKVRVGSSYTQDTYLK